MAVMSVADRGAVSASYMQEASRTLEALPVLKADLLAVVNAADAWVDANAAAFKAALPLPGRTALTAAQIARILMRVIERRYLVGA